MFGKFFAGLFGGSGRSSAEKPAKEGEAVEYSGYLIIPQCEDLGGQFRVSGWIRKPATEGCPAQAHRFERSDVVPGRDACEELMVSKAQRMIDDSGDGLFGESQDS
ncbi:HlyU family transcriptional regulator [Halomonas halocynthiae]|uniref:HlyU family transcriptional regulator n=1 Tax=Halomonas halocynthiae TaxID=176290 RepID=UPI0003FA5DC0|nr:HlyU family transcriptional regulator [Halomonas halocynthiae]